MEREVLFVAHRGESFDAPENTLAAFRLAWERGCRAIELDIRMSGDGQIVVFHDEDTERICGIKFEVARVTFSTILSCDVGAFKGLVYAGERIPLLGEVFETVPGDGKVLVEIKCGVEVLPELARCIEASGLRDDQVELICYEAEVLRQAAVVLPRQRRLLVAVLDAADVAKRATLIKSCAEIGADGVDLGFKDEVQTEVVADFHDHGLLVYTWTVNDPEVAQKQIAAGVDAVTSDRAAWLREILIGI